MPNVRSATLIDLVGEIRNARASAKLPAADWLETLVYVPVELGPTFEALKPGHRATRPFAAAPSRADPRGARGGRPARRPHGHRRRRRDRGGRPAQDDRYRRGARTRPTRPRPGRSRGLAGGGPRATRQRVVRLARPGRRSVEGARGARGRADRPGRPLRGLGRWRRSEIGHDGAELGARHVLDDAEASTASPFVHRLDKAAAAQHPTLSSLLPKPRGKGRRGPVGGASARA